MSETLLNEIRATKPEAPSALRERVRALSVVAPAREPLLDRIRYTWGWRRLVLVAPATMVVALVAAGAIGLTRDDVGTSGGDQAASVDSVAKGSAESASGSSAGEARVAPDSANFDQALSAPTTGTSVVPPSTGQLQRYEAELSLRVDDVEALSDTTKQAQQIARDYGGTVASLSYDAPSKGVGSAQITLRIPTALVQGALADLSQLGTILGQRYGIQDLQQQADSLQTQIEQTQRRIAQILAQLGSATLSDENRVVLQSRLTSNRQKLTDLRGAIRATRAEAATSTVYVTLTTEEIEPGAVGGGGALDDVKDVLRWEGIAILFFLVVAGPFIVLGILVWLALRLRRRQVETRLLEQN